VIMRKNTNDFVEAVITEARNLSAFLVEVERGKCGGDVDLAIHRAASLYGFEESSLRSLRYRWRELQDVKGSVLERLREAYEAVYEKQRVQAQIEIEIERRIQQVPTAPEQEQAPITEETSA
jgi:O-acetyl-ADP-ribose deacetylase (regulator of RNase III)